MWPRIVFGRASYFHEWIIYWLFIMVYKTSVSSSQFRTHTHTHFSPPACSHDGVWQSLRCSIHPTRHSNRLLLQTADSAQPSHYTYLSPWLLLLQCTHTHSTVGVADWQRIATIVTSALIFTVSWPWCISVRDREVKEWHSFLSRVHLTKSGSSVKMPQSTPTPGGCYDNQHKPRDLQTNSLAAPRILKTHEHGMSARTHTHTHTHTPRNTSLPTRKRLWRCEFACSLNSTTFRGSASVDLWFT